MNLLVPFLMVFGNPFGQLSPKDDKVGAIIKTFSDPSDKTVLVAAHRGDWRYAPENSIPAIEHAIAIGVDIVEIDVKKTKDGHLILMHDNLIDRTTTGRGVVEDWTLDSLRMLYLRDGLGLPTRFRIPTLEEAMLVAKGHVMLNLDKCYPYFRQAYDIAVKTGTLRQILMKGMVPAHEVQEKHGALLKEMFYMPVLNLDKPEAAKRTSSFRLLKPLAIEFIFNTDPSPHLVPCRKEIGPACRIWINALKPNLNAGHDDDLALTDPESSYGWLLAQGATIIQTDRPELLLQYLRSKGLHH